MQSSNKLQSLAETKAAIPSNKNEVKNVLEIDIIVLNKIIKNIETDSTPELMEFNINFLEQRGCQNTLLADTINELLQVANLKYKIILINHLSSRLSAEREHAIAKLEEMKMLNSPEVGLVFKNNLSHSNADIRDEAIEYLLKYDKSPALIDIILPALLKNLLVEGSIRHHAMRVLVQHKKDSIPEIAKIYEEFICNINLKYFRVYISEYFIQDIAKYLISRKEMDKVASEILIFLLSKNLSCLFSSIRIEARILLERIASKDLIINLDLENLSHENPQIKYEAVCHLLKKGLTNPVIFASLREIVIALKPEITKHIHDSDKIATMILAIEDLVGHNALQKDDNDKEAKEYINILKAIISNDKLSAEIRNMAMKRMTYLFAGYTTQLRREIRDTIISTREDSCIAVAKQAASILLESFSRDTDQYLYLHSIFKPEADSHAGASSLVVTPKVHESKPI